MRVDLFHVGPPKTATTWVYRCLREHPAIATSATDTINYYSMHYQRGPAWYKAQFNNHGAQKLFDPSFTYFHAAHAAARIAADQPHARIVICLRDPIERAYSHYWHVRRQNQECYQFADVLTYYSPFADWLLPGFYATHLERFLRYFPREQLLCLRFDTLQQDPAHFLEQILQFADVDPTFKPSLLTRRINVAAGKRPTRIAALNSLAYRLRFKVEQRQLLPVTLRQRLLGRAEYDAGPPRELIKPLLEIFEPELQRLEALLAIDLSDWRAKYA